MFTVVAHPCCVLWSVGDGVAPRSLRDIQGGRGGTYSLRATIASLPHIHASPTQVIIERNYLLAGVRGQQPVVKVGARPLVRFPRFRRACVLTFRWFVGTDSKTFAMVRVDFTET